MRTSVPVEEEAGAVVRDILLSFDSRDIEHDEKIEALTALCAVLGRGLVVGGVIKREDLQSAARSVMDQLPPGHAGIDVVQLFLRML
jgi:hypothetical protein